MVLFVHDSIEIVISGREQPAMTWPRLRLPEGQRLRLWTLYQRWVKNDPDIQRHDPYFLLESLLLIEKGRGKTFLPTQMLEECVGTQGRSLYSWLEESPLSLMERIGVTLWCYLGRVEAEVGLGWILLDPKDMETLRGGQPFYHLVCLAGLFGGPVILPKEEMLTLLEGSQEQKEKEQKLHGRSFQSFMDTYTQRGKIPWGIPFTKPRKPI